MPAGTSAKDAKGEVKNKQTCGVLLFSSSCGAQTAYGAVVRRRLCRTKREHS